MARTLKIILFFGGAMLLAACAQNQTTVSPTDPGTSTGRVTSAGPIASADRCSALPGLGPRYDTRVDSASFDPVLFDAAVLAATNKRRCANGLAPLAADTGLRRAATVHSSDMVELDFYDHTSPAPGRRKMTDRLNAAGVSYRAAAENIGRTSLLKLVSGKPYTVTDRATCAYAYDGVPIEAHSYRSLAEKFLQTWEASSQHRRNLFSDSYTRLGTGAGFEQNPQTCGDFIATQNFAA